MRPCHLRNIFKQNKTAAGLWLQYGSAQMSRTLGFLGVHDFLTVDMEHSPVDYQQAWSMMTSIADVSQGKVTPLARVASNSLFHIKRALDCGAHGVIVPIVNTKAQAIECVQHARYPPTGIRGYGGFDPNIGFGVKRPEYVTNANKEILVIAQIETPEAINNIAEIADVEGIDAFFVGPGDLTLNMGLTPGSWSDTVVFQDAIKHLKHECQKRKIPLGTLCQSPAEAALRASEGFQMLALGTENNLLQRASVADVETFRKLISKS